MSKENKPLLDNDGNPVTLGGFPVVVGSTVNMAPYNNQTVYIITPLTSILSEQEYKIIRENWVRRN